MSKSTIDTTLNYSPNFDVKKRKVKELKFIIFHYTGMKKENQAITQLTNIKSKVSSHYLIKNNGEILTLVPDLYVAWHAGVSSWRISFGFGSCGYFCLCVSLLSTVKKE